VSWALWDWAAAAYGRPQVAETCLTLQDQHGFCVAYLLWAVWAGEQAMLSAETAAKAATLARAWDLSVTSPLRAARRGLKIDHPCIAAPGREALRAQIKSDELTAERLLLAALEVLTPPPAGPPRAPAEALELARQAWRGDPPANSVLARLADAFSKP